MRVHGLFVVQNDQQSAAEVDHRYDCACFRCRCRRLESLWLSMPKATPTQEVDGHFRGCARLGKCHCPANAPRNPFFCEHSERPEACWPCAQKEKQP